MNLYPLALAALLASGATAQPDAGAATISPAGQKWAAYLDATDVEHRWLAGLHVDWKTGEADGKHVAHPEHDTHCSAFAAALAERLRVPLLRPPEHKTHLLANAQFDWLVNDGPAHGWTPVATPLEAQARANRGEFVLAIYKAKRADKPGHVAVVRPAEKSAAALAREGPQITQAGKHNFRSATLAEGFAQHRDAWGSVRAVRFFAHPLALP